MSVDVYEAIRELNGGNCADAINLLDIDRAMYRVHDWLKSGKDLSADMSGDKTTVEHLSELYNKALVLAEILDDLIFEIKVVEK